MKADAIAEVDRLKEREKRQGRKRFSKKALGLILVVLVGILTITEFTLYHIIHRKPNVSEILTNAELAILPESIEDLMVDTRPSFGTGIGGKRHYSYNRRNLFIRFQAEPHVIDSFIDSSPAIGRNTFHPPKRNYGGDLDESPIWWWFDETMPGRVSDMSWAHNLTEYRNLTGSRICVDDDKQIVRILVVYVANPSNEGKAFIRLRRLLYSVTTYAESQLRQMNALLQN
jgi:hypothetical protein